MASPSKPTEDGSDKNCVETCNLKYGISNTFNENVRDQLKVKASKAQIKPQLFDDPNEESKYNHLMDDIMLKTFDDESEKKIFRKALEGMESNYPEILNGSKKCMFYCPTAFNFDSRIAANETSAPEVLEEIQASLKAKKNSTPPPSTNQKNVVKRKKGSKILQWIKSKVLPSNTQLPIGESASSLQTESQSKSSLTESEKANLKVIQNHLRKLRPQLAEQEFVDALACFFYKHRGIFIHSLKLDEHLKVLSDKAKLYRRQNRNASFGLTDLEKKLAEQFNISEKSLEVFANMIVNHILTHPKLTDTVLVNGRTIREAIDDQLTGNENMYTKKLFKPGQNYSMEEIKDGCKLGKFESEVQFAGESDLLIMLPDSKLILSIEIKRHMKDSGCKSKSTAKIDKNMKSASNQLNKNAEFISSRHGAILSPEWKFVKVCAISPTFNKSEKICPNCHRFILTSEILETAGGLDKWWKNTGLATREKKFDAKSKAEAYNEFQHFFYRLVCLSSVRVVPAPFHTWSQVQGHNPYHMSAGHTKATPDAQTQYSSSSTDVKSVLHRPHDAYKVLFFNKDQYCLLANDKLYHAVFMCDFGAGKSLIGKEKAIQTAENEDVKINPEPVFFISLVGVDDQGFVDEHEHIFDIYTKEYDFFGTSVIVKSAQDLGDFYESYHKRANKKYINIYELAKFFVEQHSNGHFVIDECPFRTNGANYDKDSVKQVKDFLIDGTESLHNNSSLFWVALQSNQLADITHLERGRLKGPSPFLVELKQMKKDLAEAGWVLPQLELNMRNPISISNIVINTFVPIDKVQNSINRLRSGTNVVGEVPIFIDAHEYGFWVAKKDEILSFCIEEISKKDKKNIVVLCDNDMYFKDARRDLKRLIKDKTVLEYPSTESKQKGTKNVKDFIEKEDHILVTKKEYFNGCEASNIVYLNSNWYGVRNALMRGVKNVVYVRLNDCIWIQSGMKQDKRFE